MRSWPEWRVRVRPEVTKCQRLSQLNHPMIGQFLNQKERKVLVIYLLHFPFEYNAVRHTKWRESIKKGKDSSGVTCNFCFHVDYICTYICVCINNREDQLTRTTDCTNPPCGISQQHIPCFHIICSHWFIWRWNFLKKKKHTGLGALLAYWVNWDMEWLREQKAYCRRNFETPRKEFILRKKSDSMTWAQGEVGVLENCGFENSVVVSLNLPQSGNAYSRCISQGVKVCAEPKRDVVQKYYIWSNCAVGCIWRMESASALLISSFDLFVRVAWGLQSRSSRYRIEASSRLRSDVTGASGSDLSPGLSHGSKLSFVQQSFESRNRPKWALGLWPKYKV